MALSESMSSELNSIFWSPHNQQITTMIGKMKIPATQPVSSWPLQNPSRTNVIISARFCPLKSEGNPLGWIRETSLPRQIYNANNARNPWNFCCKCTVHWTTSLISSTVTTAQCTSSSVVNQVAVGKQAVWRCFGVNCRFKMSFTKIGNPNALSSKHGIKRIFYWKSCLHSSVCALSHIRMCIIASSAVIWALLSADNAKTRWSITAAKTISDIIGGNSTGNTVGNGKCWRRNSRLWSV